MASTLPCLLPPTSHSFSQIHWRLWHPPFLCAITLATILDGFKIYKEDLLLYFSPYISSLQRPLVFSNTYIHGHTLVLVNTSLKCQLFTFWHIFQPLWSLTPSLWSDLFFNLICPPGSLSVFSCQSTYSLDDLLSWFLPHGWQHRLLLWFLCTSHFASHLPNPESMLNPPTWLLTPISKLYQRKTTQSYKTISLSIHGLHPGLGLLVVLE